MTRPFSLFFDDFDNLWEVLTKGSGVNYVNTNFPPVDVLIDEDKNLFFKFALAGYNKEDINIFFSGDYMRLKLEPKEEVLKSKYKYLNKGIKHAKATSSYYVPYQKYDTEKVEASFEGGLLKVKIPSKSPERAHLIKIK